MYIVYAKEIKSFMGEWESKIVEIHVEADKILKSQGKFEFYKDDTLACLIEEENVILISHEKYSKLFMIGESGR